jgi:RNA polymerase sigma factor (sigma-70 family)
MNDSCEPNSTLVVQGLLNRLRAGDKVAAQELISASMNRLQVLSRKIMGDIPTVRRWEETDDVAQNAMLKIWKALSTVHPETPLDYFRLAAAVIRRDLIDLARHYYGPRGMGANHANSGLMGDSEMQSPVNLKAADSTDPETLGRWTDFHEYVEALPDEERTLFDLLWYQGLSLVHATEVMQIPERTLRRRWKTARVNLYRALLHDDTAFD